MSSGMTVKMKHHRTEIERGDNGGLKVVHHFKLDDDGDEYPHTMKKETNHYGADEHKEAMADVAEKCCDGGLGDNQPGATKGKGKSEKETIHEARAKVGHAIATLGRKQGASLSATK